MGGSELLPCKPTLNPISSAAKPCCNRSASQRGPKPWEGNATTRFHQSCCWCGNRLAAHRACTATGEAGGVALALRTGGGKRRAARASPFYLPFGLVQKSWSDLRTRQ